MWWWCMLNMYVMFAHNVMCICLLGSRLHFYFLVRIPLRLEIEHPCVNDAIECQSARPDHKNIKNKHLRLKMKKEEKWSSQPKNKKSKLSPTANHSIVDQSKRRAISRDECRPSEGVSK